MCLPIEVRQGLRSVGLVLMCRYHKPDIPLKNKLQPLVAQDEVHLAWFGEQQGRNMDMLVVCAGTDSAVILYQ
jgi:hypothetical protein